jgi:hypothetical protein
MIILPFRAIYWLSSRYFIAYTRFTFDYFDAVPLHVIIAHSDSLALISLIVTFTIPKSNALLHSAKSLLRYLIGLRWYDWVFLHRHISSMLTSSTQLHIPKFRTNSHGSYRLQFHQAMPSHSSSLSTWPHLHCLEYFFAIFRHLFEIYMRFLRVFSRGDYCLFYISRR